MENNSQRCSRMLDAYCNQMKFFRIGGSRLKDLDITHPILKNQESPFVSKYVKKKKKLPHFMTNRKKVKDQSKMLSIFTSKGITNAERNNEKAKIKKNPEQQSIKGTMDLTRLDIFHKTLTSFNFTGIKTRRHFRTQSELQQFTKRSTNSEEKKKRQSPSISRSQQNKIDRGRSLTNYLKTTSRKLTFKNPRKQNCKTEEHQLTGWAYENAQSLIYNTEGF